MRHTPDASHIGPSDPPSPPWSAQRPCLILVAAPREHEAVSSAFASHASFEVVESGVGPVNAALAAVTAYKPSRHAAVISVGVAGAHPRRGPKLRDVVLAEESLYGDVGLRTTDGLVSLSEMGFPLLSWTQTEDEAGAPLNASSQLRAVLEPLADASVPIATLSACSGTIEAADELADRGCVVEAMEGAAVAHAVAHAQHIAGLDTDPAGLPFAELRVISNTTGPRHEQIWDLDGALARLTHLAESIASL